MKNKETIFVFNEFKLNVKWLHEVERKGIKLFWLILTDSNNNSFGICNLLLFWTFILFLMKVNKRI